MDIHKTKYIAVRIFRFTSALALFTAISSLSNKTSYFTAQRMTTEVSEDVIRAIHIILSVLAYHSFLRMFIITDSAVRCDFCDSQAKMLRYLASSSEVKISFIITVVFFLIFPNAFAVKSVYGWLEIPKAYVYIICASAFLVTFVLTWFEGLRNLKKTQEKIRKEKSKSKDISHLIKYIVSSCLAYPIMAYLLPIFFPTFRTLPQVAVMICLVFLPLVIALILFFNIFAYLRAFIIRFKFLRNLKKAAIKNGYVLSKIAHPYSSLFVDHDERSFTIIANGKEYDCKLLSGLHYGDPMYFEEEGRGKIIRRFTFKYRSLRAAPFSQSGTIWHKLSDDLAQFHTDFTYAFDGEGTKVLIVSPTPHTIYAAGYGQNKLLDVNDKVYGYTLMTGTAFINALERDAVR
ncbi:MAG: hypothetical protein IJ002_06085 [Clostridia bacterium]|nr:hypothetical protein [Clostridia bacterium]